jgi:hypothetical protein
MRSTIFALSFLVGVSSLGCAFSQWTDHYFLATTGGRPVYPNRTVTGLMLVPLAFAADIVTFPVQAIVLVCGGDEILYTDAEPKGDLGWRVHPQARQALAALHDGMAPASGPLLVGVGGEGELHPLDATPAQVEAVVERMKQASERRSARSLARSL